VRDVGELVDEQIEALAKVGFVSPVGFGKGVEDINADCAAITDYTSCGGLRGFRILVSPSPRSTPLHQGPPAAE
jgi:hypothetical protein